MVYTRDNDRVINITIKHALASGAGGGAVKPCMFMTGYGLKFLLKGYGTCMTDVKLCTENDKTHVLMMMMIMNRVLIDVRFF